MIAPIRRVLIGIALIVLAFGTAGCGGSGADTDCSINSCTVTFDRGVDASASILGVKAELVDVKGDQVTLEIADQPVTVPVDGEKQAGGFDVSVESVTKTTVVVKISRHGG